MQPPMSTANANEAIPSSQAFTMVGVTYGLYGLGLFLFWSDADRRNHRLCEAAGCTRVAGITLPLADQHLLVVARCLDGDDRRDAHRC